MKIDHTEPVPWKMMLAIAGGALVVALIYLYVFIARGGSIYIVNESGYQAFAGKAAVHQTNASGLRKVTARLLKSDILDMLWVSHGTNQHNGVTVCILEGKVQLSISFGTHAEQSELKAFKEAMAPLGLMFEEDSDDFNSGVEEEFRVTTLEYTLPSDADAVAIAIETALDHLYGKSEMYYMTGSRFANGPGEGTGLKFRAAEDPLQEILKH